MAYKGTVSAEQRAKLRNAVEALQKARAARDDAVREALLAGGSVREVAAATGMGTGSVGKISARLRSAPEAAQQADAARWDL